MMGVGAKANSRPLSELCTKAVGGGLVGVVLNREAK